MATYQHFFNFGCYTLYIGLEGIFVGSERGLTSYPIRYRM